MRAAWLALKDTHEFHGLLRTFVRFEMTRDTGSYGFSSTTANVDQAFVQFAGLTAGVTDSFWDFKPYPTFAIPFVSDFFDFSVYLDADEEDLHRWYVNRFLRLRHTAFRDPLSYFRRYAEISEAEAIEVAEGLWSRINLVNLRDNILPTRQRASLILKKGASHRIEEVALRRL